MSDVDDPAIKTRTRLEGETESSPELEEGHTLVCASCQHVITESKAAIPVDGMHEHVQANPFGFVFCFGCFSVAPGCALVEGEHSADSWFQGYVWRIALCAGCTTHLGWYFRGDDSAFFGLLLNKLRRQ